MSAPPASAQRADSVATDTTEAPQAERKSPTRALLYSLGGTAVPMLGIRSESPVGRSLFLVGLIAGPSAGHFYAGSARQAWVGIGIRAGTALVSAGTAVTIARAVFEEGGVL